MKKRHLQTGIASVQIAVVSFGVILVGGFWLFTVRGVLLYL